MLTPRLAESWAVLPLSTDIAVWAWVRDGTMMVAWTMLLFAALTRMVM